VRRDEFLACSARAGAQVDALAGIAGFLNPAAGTILLDARRSRPGADRGVRVPEYALAAWMNVLERRARLKSRGMHQADGTRWRTLPRLATVAASSANIRTSVRRHEHAVAVARTLANLPSHADGTTVRAVDAQTRMTLQEELVPSRESRGSPVFITHSVERRSSSRPRGGQTLGPGPSAQFDVPLRAARAQLGCDRVRPALRALRDRPARPGGHAPGARLKRALIGRLYQQSRCAIDAPASAPGNYVVNRRAFRGLFEETMNAASSVAVACPALPRALARTSILQGRAPDRAVGVGARPTRWARARPALGDARHGSSSRNGARRHGGLRLRRQAHPMATAPGTVSTMPCGEPVPQLGYDPLRDFVPITEIATIPNLGFVNPEKTREDLAEFIARSEEAAWA
jgi:hypothetical protein